MRSLSFLVVTSALLALAGCSKSAVDSVAPTPMGQMQVAITDAPGDFDAVNLMVTEVSANGPSGWQVLSAASSTVNLLSLNNGVFASLADAAVPAAGYSQIRLKLAAGSNVVVDGVTYPLKVPSGMQSGLKLNGSFDVAAGGVLSLQMDFDAARSVHQNGAGDYSLSPVIRLLASTQAGAIAGHVPAAVTGANVQVMQDDVEVTSTWAKPDGSFKISVLPAGIYSIVVTSSTGRTSILQDVVVKVGQTTSVGSIRIPV